MSTEVKVDGGLKENQLYVFQGGAFLRAQIQEPQSHIPRPDKFVFEDKTGDVVEHLLKSPQPVNEFDRVEYPESGGIFVYCKGVKYPTKGFPTPESCQANNIVKRVFIGQLRYLAKNPLALLGLLTKKGREMWLDIFTSFAEIALGPYFLEDIRYARVCREIRTFAKVFMEELGISKSRSETFAKTFATMFEYDNAYLLRLQDLANETTNEKLLKTPRQELKRLLELLKQRDSRISMAERFGSAVFLFSLALLVPKINRAYKKALNSISIENIQMDEGDRYHVLRWDTYDFFGQSIEERGNKFLAIHDGVQPKTYIMQS